MEGPAGSNGRPPAQAADLIREACAQEQGPPGDFEAPPEIVKARQRVLDHDPKRPLEVKVVLRTFDLAAKVAALELREATDDDVRQVLEAISGTPKGKSLTVIRGAKQAWLETTLRAADHFEADLAPRDDPFAVVDLGEAELPTENAQPPPHDDE